jgi:hypothetical protein
MVQALRLLIPLFPLLLVSSHLFFCLFLLFQGASAQYQVHPHAICVV